MGLDPVNCVSWAVPLMQYGDLTDREPGVPNPSRLLFLDVSVTRSLIGLSIEPLSLLAITER